MKTKLFLLALFLLALNIAEAKDKGAGDKEETNKKSSAVFVNTSFGDQEVKINFGMISIYKAFQQQSGYTSVREMFNVTSKDDLSTAWYNYQDTEENNLNSNEDFGKRRLIISDPL